MAATLSGLTHEILIIFRFEQSMRMITSEGSVPRSKHAVDSTFADQSFGFRTGRQCYAELVCPEMTATAGTLLRTTTSGEVPHLSVTIHL